MQNVGKISLSQKESQLAPPARSPSVSKPATPLRKFSRPPNLDFYCDDSGVSDTQRMRGPEKQAKTPTRERGSGSRTSLSKKLKNLIRKIMGEKNTAGGLSKEQKAWVDQATKEINDINILLRVYGELDSTTLERAKVLVSNAKVFSGPSTGLAPAKDIGDFIEQVEKLEGLLPSNDPKNEKNKKSRRPKVEDRVKEADERLPLSELCGLPEKAFKDTLAGMSKDNLAPLKKLVGDTCRAGTALSLSPHEFEILAAGDKKDWKRDRAFKKVSESVKTFHECSASGNQEALRAACKSFIEKHEYRDSPYKYEAAFLILHALPPR